MGEAILGIVGLLSESAQARCFNFADRVVHLLGTIPESWNLNDYWRSGGFSTKFWPIIYIMLS